MTINLSQTFQNPRWKGITLFLCGIAVGVVGKKIARKTQALIHKALPTTSQKDISLTDSQRKRIATHPNHILNLYQVMKDVHDILTKHKIPYRIEAGTLLGAVRHQGIIPWDDDLDISIMEDFEQRFLSLKSVFKALGYSIKPMNFGWTIMSHKLSFISTIGREMYGFCDVFIRTKDEKGNLIYRNKKFREKWINEYWTPQDSKATRLYKFGNLQVLGADNPYLYLNRAFPGWQNNVKVKIHSGEHVPFEEFKISPKDLKPAQPLGPLEDRVK